MDKGTAEMVDRNFNVVRQGIRRLEFDPYCLSYELQKPFELSVESLNELLAGFLDKVIILNTERLNKFQADMGEGKNPTADEERKYEKSTLFIVAIAEHIEMDIRGLTSAQDTLNTEDLLKDVIRTKDFVKKASEYVLTGSEKAFEELQNPPQQRGM